MPSAFPVANFLNFFKLTQLLYFGRVEADKTAKSKVGPILWDTLYLPLNLHFILFLDLFLNCTHYLTVIILDIFANKE